ncbi:MAG: hypothetical protein JJE50_05155 [Actinomycetales bacterium]|nr:hypothetical protein [Actinomycetales bacterium]
MLRLRQRPIGAGVTGSARGADDVAQPGHGVLTDDARRSIEELLAGPDAEAARLYPGDDGSRQPVHTVYVPGDRYTPELTTQWGSAARAARQDGGGIEHLLEVHGLVPDAAECAVIGAQVLAKLEREPVEDLRIDFEDGYGDRGDAAEDDAVVAAARAVAVAGRAGQLPPYVGIRFKCFEPSTRARGVVYVPGEQRADGSLTSHRPRRLHDHLLHFQQVENRLHDTESTCSASGSPTSQTRAGRPTRTSDPDERSAPR